MKLGQQALEALQAEITGRLRPGDDLVVAGETGISGTLQLIGQEREVLRNYFSESFLCMGADTLEKCMISREETCWEDSRISALYFTENGGILSGLWKMAEASGVGLDVDLRRIPIRQETIEVCERVGVDPYKLEAEGSVLIGTAQGDALVRDLEMSGIHAAVIGHADGGNDRILHSGEIIRYLERPRLHLSEIISGKDREKEHGKA
ncbi:AIR synthase-related protein [Blautia sp. MSJ-19]|uniref:AIR synthase-related protein n=1 Tax=Blautia sp. MSJ-19 TaxID=2841517 RepID=UPI001C0EA45A|nr:AIR synthase-related protein [Blautia sp. MSJ-19]MBU5481622.1 hydrogenase maturation factor [Blautia sp. MSJ-19]